VNNEGGAMNMIPMTILLMGSILFARIPGFGQAAPGWKKYIAADSSFSFHYPNRLLV
jgi:hypothetical protein